MIMSDIFIDIFLSILGFGLSIMFCTTFCRACHRFREEQSAREALRQNEQDVRPPSIYFIPFHGSMSQEESEDNHREPRHSHDIQPPPQYSTIYCGPPPSYNELGFKPEDLPPVYTEFNIPPCPPAPPLHMDMAQPQTQSRQ